MWKREKTLQYKTHITVSLAIGIPLMAATDTLTASSVVALTLGATFPDIDEPHSWIGRRTWIVSDIIHHLFGHRGITHSLIGLLVISLGTVLLTTVFNINMMVGKYFILGYALHLLEDSFSKSGVAWFRPFINKKLNSGFGIVYYRTGRLAEKLILLVCIFVLMFEMKEFIFFDLFN